MISSKSCFDQVVALVLFILYFKRVLWWTLSGTTRVTTSQWLNTHLFLQENKSLVQTLKRFWEMKAVEQSTTTAETQTCEQHFSTHTTLHSDGRCVVRHLTKMDPTQLGYTLLSAEQRMHATKRRVERHPDLKVQYHNFMKGCEKLGHMNLLKSQEGNQTCYFLPHHPVLKETSTTTKTRGVFDWSANTLMDCQKRHIKSGLYCSTGSVFHYTAVHNPSGVLHGWHRQDVLSD